MVISYTTLGGSWRSELLVNATGPLGAMTNLQPSTLTGGGTITNAPIGTWPAADPTGAWNFEFFESFNDAGQDAAITDITITVNFVSPPDITAVATGGVFDPATAILTLDATTDEWTIEVIDNTTGCVTDLSGACPIDEPQIQGPSGPFCQGDRDVTYSIEGGYAGTWTVTGAGTITATGVYSPDAAGTATITFTPDIDQLGLACGTDPIVLNTEVYPVSSPLFTLPTEVCITGLPIALDLDTPNAEATWEGNGVTDNADGTATFNPATAGVYTICASVGTPSCKMTHCASITVSEEGNTALGDITICEDNTDFNLTSMFIANQTDKGGFFTIDCDGPGGADPVIVNGNEIAFAATCSPLHTTGAGSTGAPGPEASVAGVASGAMNGFTPAFTDGFYFYDDDADGSGATPRAYTMVIGTFDLSDADECASNRIFSFDYTYRPLGGDIFQVIIDDGVNPPIATPIPGNSTFASNGTVSNFMLDLTALGATTNNVTISINYDDNGDWNWYHGFDNIQLVYGSNIAGTGNDILYSEDFGAGGATYSAPIAAPAAVAAATSFDLQQNPITLAPGTCEVTYTIGSGSCMNTSTANLTITPRAEFRPDAFTVCDGETLNLNPTTTGGTWTVTPSTGGTITADVFTPAVGMDGLVEVCYTFETIANPCKPTCTQILVQPAANATLVDAIVCEDDVSTFNLTGLFIGGTTTPGGAFCIDLNDGNGPINVNGNELGSAGVQITADPAALANATICDAAFGGLSADDGTLPFGTWINGFGGDPFLFFDDDEATAAAAGCGATVAFSIPATDISALGAVTLDYTSATINTFGNVFEVYAVWNGGIDEALLMGNTGGNPSTQNIDVLAAAPAAAGATDLTIEFRWDDSNGWAWGFALDDIVLTGDGAELFSEDFQITAPIPLDLAAGTYPVTYKVGGDCLETQTANLTVLEPITATLDVVNVACPGTSNPANDGSITATNVMGGSDEIVPTYTFLWSTGETTPLITVSEPGVYVLTATTSQGNVYCVRTRTIEVIISISPEISSVEIDGFGINNTIIVSTDVVGDFEYRLDNGEFQSEEIFEDVLPGVREFREEHSNGIRFVDFRLGYQINENLKANFLLKNALNTESAVRPGIIDAPRNLTLRLDYKF